MCEELDVSPGVAYDCVGVWLKEQYCLTTIKLTYDVPQVDYIFTIF